MTNLFSKMPISKKLPIWMIGLAVFNIILTTTFGAWLTINDGIVASEKKTLAITEAKKDSLHSYLNSIELDLLITANNGFTKEAVKDFKTAWDFIDGNPTQYLQKAYLPDGLDAAKRIDVVKADDGSIYSEYHAQYHPFFKDMLEKRGYYDIFLFDTKGNLTYTVFKELDYATNMYSGKWKDTDLANAYKAALKSQKEGVSFFDFKPYEPSYGRNTGNC